MVGDEIIDIDIMIISIISLDVLTIDMTSLDIGHFVDFDDD